MEALWKDLETSEAKAIVLGDLNGKAADWGSPNTDRRGRLLCEWLAALNMVVLNDGTPIFFRRDHQSHIDITIASENIVRNIGGWEVLNIESMSNHRLIYE
nr:unnamed protein product [Callosobruchus analis]